MPDRFRGAPKGLIRAPGSSGVHPAPPTVLGQLLRPIRPNIIQPPRPRPNRKREDQAQQDVHLRLLATAMESAGDGMLITGADGAIVWANAAVLRMTGYRLDELVGASPSLLKSGRHDATFYATLWNTILSGEMWQGYITNRRRDGSLYSEEMTIAPIRDRCRALTHFVAVKREFSSNRPARPPLDARIADPRDTAVQLAASLAEQLHPTGSKD